MKHIPAATDFGRTQGPPLQNPKSMEHIYFVAETKGSMNSMQLREIEKSKIHCAREHFKAISGDNVVYDVVNSYTSLLEKVMK